jgi:hypothetical protein
MNKKEINSSVSEVSENVSENKSIEELKVKFCINESVFEALKVHYDWANGFIMTEDQFQSAIKKWMNSPVNERS